METGQEKANMLGKHGKNGETSYMWGGDKSFVIGC